MRNVSGIFYPDHFQRMHVFFPNFEPTVILSQPDGEPWRGLRGRVTDLICRRVTEEDAYRTEAYFCGGGSMINDVKSLLLGKGIGASHVHHENFF